ncbi:MAG: hypothetical protein JW395_0416 [Nitrospira sp.]|nr:hypothetical protein [Nitrospira sp.]
MIAEVNRFSFVAESVWNVFDFMSELTDDHYVQAFEVREIAQVQLVRVTTDARMNCMLEAMFATDDELMLQTLRQIGRVEDTVAE